MEEWKTIPSHPTYEASNMGRIRNGKTLHVKSQHESNTGYLSVGLKCGDVGGRRSLLKTVHRLVMEAFCGGSELTVNHKNRDRKDNRIENLEYMTIKDNIYHSYDSGHKDGRHVVMVSKSGDRIMEFDSMRLAEAHIGKKGLRRAINDRSSTCGGCLWFDSDLFDDSLDNSHAPKKRSSGWAKSVEKVSLGGEVLCVYDSADHAVVYENISKASISVSNKTGRPVGGFYWRYLDF